VTAHNSDVGEVRSQPRRSRGFRWSEAEPVVTLERSCRPGAATNPPPFQGGMPASFHPRVPLRFTRGYPAGHSFGVRVERPCPSLPV